MDVYNKIWLATHDKNIPMRVVYRMRGLMGEATEEFIEKYVYHNLMLKAALRYFPPKLTHPRRRKSKLEFGTNL